jgi:CRISPR system Cascade subunit CasE
VVERPQALFGAEAVVVDGERFADLLARGIGRHRAFGFGMVLVAPPR